MYSKSSILDISRDSAGESTSKQYLDHIELQMRQLEDMIKDNNAKQEEIRALRDGVGTPNPSSELY